MEIAPFIYVRDKAVEFDRFVHFLAGLGYHFTNATTGRPVPSGADELRRIITPRGGINALLLPP